MKPYVPGPLPPDGIDRVALVGPIGRANAALARYDGIVQGIVNPEILLAPLLTREAVLSSRIEGTQASLEDVLQFEADAGGARPTPAMAADIQEVVNCRRALREGVRELETRPIGINLLRSLHATLLSGVRGRDREPGEVRRTQNWIGRPGSTIEEATFVPPEPSRVMDALTDWENYLYRDERDTLVQVALLKGQFELIHPFRDGNGRIGRMLIPLILYRKRVIASPTFYISASIERHRSAYYDRLLGLSQDHDWTGWCRFFLERVIEQAEEDGAKARAIQALYGEMKYRVPEVTRSHYATAAVDTLFIKPIFSLRQFVELSEIPSGTAKRIIGELERNGILVAYAEGRGSRPTVYDFSHLLGIVTGGSSD
jgi:Fic family protein